jgi:hypothetical protein
LRSGSFAATRCTALRRRCDALRKHKKALAATPLRRAAKTQKGACCDGAAKAAMCCDTALVCDAGIQQQKQWLAGSLKMTAS